MKLCKTSLDNTKRGGGGADAGVGVMLGCVVAVRSGFSAVSIDLDLWIKKMDLERNAILNTEVECPDGCGPGGRRYMRDTRYLRTLLILSGLFWIWNYWQ